MDNSKKINIAQNRKANFNYHILDFMECGIVLHGSEVKSLRAGHCSLEESYGRLKDNEVWLIGADIPEYTEANQFNHNPKRPRKLLLHRNEINKFANKALFKGFSLVPLKLYFNGKGIAKLLLGVGKGKKQYDKREDLKRKDLRREIGNIK